VEEIPKDIIRKYIGEAEALKNLRTGISELRTYRRLLFEFSKESNQTPYESWESVYRNGYVKDEKHGFL